MLLEAELGPSEWASRAVSPAPLELILKLFRNKFNISKGSAYGISIGSICRRVYKSPPKQLSLD